jgi:tetratricopeptide (TPR) repeat protein
LPALIALLLAAGCHDAPTPSAVPSAVNPILPPFASGPIEESSESGAAALPDGFEDGTALITSYRNRLNRNPQDLEALILLGNASYDIGSYAEAEDLYRRALTIAPEHTQARTDLATALHRQLLLAGVAGGLGDHDNSAIIAVLRSLIAAPR